ncbi:MAG: hypothetical protein WBN52_00465, partial [Eudoraea sp.]|uniref:hypothetical protein n=1 Tax=Eudoraea sp. TaxID=1979955 RepID=UPI003C70E806
MKNKMTIATMLLCMVFGSGLMAQQNHSLKNHSLNEQTDSIMALETLIKNVNIFNGTSEKLITGKDVVYMGNKIQGI